MNEWLLVLVLAAGGAAFLAIPFLRKASGTAETAANAAAGAAPMTKPLFRGMDRMTAITISAIVMAGAAGLYAMTGPSAPVPGQVPNLTMPSVADNAQPGAQAGTQPKLPDVDTMIQRVVDRLKANPNNAEDWRMLGWSYFETQRYPEAVDAYKRAVALQPDSAALQSAYGEALVLAGGGKPTPDAMKAFDVALKSTPNDERALHYVGLAKRDSGDAKGAVADWLVALKNAKPESLWAPRLRAEILETAKTASIDVSKDLPPAMTPESFAAAPTAAAQQAQSMSPEEQQSMIRNMVAGLDERLAQNPHDREGWMRLIRSRKVLGQPDLARTALDRALTAFKDDPATQTELKTAALQLGVSSAP